jgi:hypothetical protein
VTNCRSIEVWRLRDAEIDGEEFRSQRQAARLWSDRTVGLSGDLRDRRSRQTATPCNVSARMLARSGRTLLDSGKYLARPTTCLQIGERREKMNEVGAEPLIVMAEPDLNPSEGFALAPRGCDHLPMADYRVCQSAIPFVLGGAHSWLTREPWPRRSTNWTSITSVADAILVNAPTLGGRYLLQGQAVAISRTTGIYAFPFSRMSRRESTRGKVGVTRIECSRTQ